MNQTKIGTFISNLRKEKGFTQEELANKLNVTSKSVSRWENGKTMPDYSILKDLCNILDTNVNELLNGERIKEENKEELYNTNLYTIYSNYEKESKKLRLFKKLVFVCGGLFIIIISRVIVALCLLLFLEIGNKPIIDTNVDNYSKILAELKESEYAFSDLEIFPSVIDKSKCLSFEYLKQSMPFDDDYLFYLVMDYDNEEYWQEETRIKNLSIDERGIAGLTKYFDTNTINALYIESNFHYPTYVLEYREDNIKEYVLFDEANTKITYVFSQFIDAPEKVKEINIFTDLNY